MALTLEGKYLVAVLMERVVYKELVVDTGNYRCKDMVADMVMAGYTGMKAGHTDMAVHIDTVVRKDFDNREA
jgi:hypothetical protein